MHYTAKLACHLPVPIQFDWRIVVLSLVVGVIGSTAALAVATRGKAGWLRDIAASVLLGGIGISGLHYTAMAGMRVPGLQLHYSAPLVNLSVLLAIVVCFIALTLSFHWYGRVGGRFRKHGGALLRGSANPIMHYTAMAGVTFVYSGEVPDLSHAVSIHTVGLFGISIVPATVIIAGLVTSLVDYLHKQKTLLDALFEQAPHAVVLMGLDHRIIRVNREFKRTFGYTPAETVGRRLSELIVPEESREETERNTDALARAERVNAEGVRRRKDGTPLHVSIVHVPVSLPGEEKVVYSIYTDITERKRAENALRMLSHRLLQAEDEERRRIAKELHDSTAQDLVAVMMNLGLLQEALGERDKKAGEIIADSLAILENSASDIRTLSYVVHPPRLDETGLAGALTEYAAGFGRRAGIRVQVELPPDLDRLPEEIELALFRVVQEGLANVLRHSKSDTATICLTKEKDSIVLEVIDHGCGLPSTMTPESPGALGVGIAGMRERMQYFGGRLELQSSTEGTTVRAVLPLPAKTK
jgi:PAS domain S-box-containing protein